jgi:UDP-N-acetylmuramoyl-tripeptide--D-alanyl-D-alanine ligase
VADRTRPAQPPAFDPLTFAAALGGELLHSATAAIRGAAVDSRKVEPGNAFFALPGERTDGHRFLDDAIGRGAAALVVRERPAADALERFASAGVSVVLVADCLEALHRAAAEWRSRFDPLVVGVTGSLAKTSTKEQVAELLAERWTVLRNRGNENNEIGLPLTLLRLSPGDHVAVLEMGMYEPGDIALLAALARPHIGVVTAVRGAHVERAGSIEAIERGKRELLEALPGGGAAVLNADDVRVSSMAADRPDLRVLRYGFAPDADVTADEVTSLGAEGMRFWLRTPIGEAEMTSPALGRHSVHNALAAAAVGVATGLDLPTIAAGMARPLSMPHRTVLMAAGEWQLLDDTYNAAPDSMAAVLDLLAGLPGRHVAVLGEMLELGEASDDAHREVGRHAARVSDVLVAVGPMAPLYADAAVAAGMPDDAVFRAADRDAALAELEALLLPGDVVLLKASRGAELDLLVDELRRLSAAERAR